MKHYKVSEDRLTELLRGENKAESLESGGVDNWSWYGESLSEGHNDKDEDGGFYNPQLDLKWFKEIIAVEPQ